MRCFIGITLSNILKNELYACAQNEFNINGIKIIPKENLHITVKFLGDIDSNTLHKIKNLNLSVNNIDNNINSTVGFMNVFPSYKNIKIIWVGAPGLINLLKNTDEKLSCLGFKKEKNYIPHITICRVKYIKKENKKEIVEKINKYKNTNFGNITVDKLTLFKSELSPKGAKYSILKEYSLI